MSNSIHTLTAPIVIIGFGNPDYSDSSVGARVADEVATRRLPNVLALTVRHLTPDLSEVLAKAEVAILWMLVEYTNFMASKSSPLRPQV